MRRREKKLGEILIEKGLITEAQLSDALAAQRSTNEFLGAVLLKRRYIKEGDLLKALSEQFNIPLIGIKNMYIDWDFVKKFSPTLILDSKCVPVKKEDDSVTVAILNPLDAWALKKVEEEFRGMRPSFALVSHEDMEEIIQRYKKFMRRTILDL